MIHEYSTTECRQVGHPEFTFKVDTSRIVSDDVEWLTQTIEDMVASGTIFAEGETIQIGWGLLKVRRSGDGTLGLLEPDYESKPPLEWVDTVTHTLSHLRLQKDVCESYFDIEEAIFPSLRESAIVCTAIASASGVVMDRVAAASPDSGWFIGCDLPEHDHNDPPMLECVSLYEAVQRNRRALPFLALPPGVLVHSDDEGIRVCLDDAFVAPRESSYVQRLLARG